MEARLVKVLTFFALVYVALNVFLYFYQERMMFFPGAVDPSFSYSFAQPSEQVYIDVNGARLHALHFKTKKPKGLILYFHGNGGNLTEWGTEGADLVKSGYDVLMPDYRGYGKSTGKITSEAQLLADAESVYKYAWKQYEDAKITLYGRSLGTGLAIKLAADHPVHQLILESAYLSMESLAIQKYPVVLPLILKYPLRSNDWAGGVKCPVFMVHGSKDEIIPVNFSERLIERFHVPVRYMKIEGAGHNDLASFAEFRNALADALK